MVQDSSFQPACRNLRPFQSGSDDDRTGSCLEIHFGLNNRKGKKKNSHKYRTWEEREGGRVRDRMRHQAGRKSGRHHRGSRQVDAATKKRETQIDLGLGLGYFHLLWTGLSLQIISP